MVNILREMADALLPRRCVICGEILPAATRHICPECLEHQTRTYYHRMKDNPMEQRLLAGPKIEHATALFFYQPGRGMAKAIYEFKYQGRWSLAQELGRLMGRELFTTGFFTDANVLMPVPLHWYKRLRRGYSQTTYLARGISEATGIPVCEDLKAVKPHRSQTALTHEGRARNVAGAFQLKNPAAHRDAHVLLIDDVCTTGATLSEAARAVKEGVAAAVQGDVRVSVLTLAVTL